MVNLVEQWQLGFFEVWSKSSPAGTSENVISSTFKKMMTRKIQVHHSVSEMCSVAPKTAFALSSTVMTEGFSTFVEPADSNLSTDTRLRQSVG